MPEAFSAVGLALGAVPTVVGVAVRPWVVVVGLAYLAALVVALGTLFRGIDVQKRHGCAGYTPRFLEGTVRRFGAWWPSSRSRSCLLWS